MHTTPPSLLMRLKQPDAEMAWRRFVEIYTPLLFYWARQAGLKPPDDAARRGAGAVLARFEFFSERARAGGRELPASQRH